MKPYSRCSGGASGEFELVSALSTGKFYLRCMHACYSSCTETNVRRPISKYQQQLRVEAGSRSGALNSPNRFLTTSAAAICRGGKISQSSWILCPEPTLETIVQLVTERRLERRLAQTGVEKILVTFRIVPDGGFFSRGFNNNGILTSSQT
jgi:hypothetical protein